MVVQWRVSPVILKCLHLHECFSSALTTFQHILVSSSCMAFGALNSVWSSPVSVWNDFPIFGCRPPISNGTETAFKG